MPYLVRTLGNGLYRLEEDIYIPFAAGFELIIPKGFVTDWASVPTILHWFIKPTHHKILRASLIHDWLYCTHITSRQVADSIFYQVMRIDGMPRWKAKLCFWSAQVFGKNGYQYQSPAFFKRESPELYEKYFTNAFDYEEID